MDEGIELLARLNDYYGSSYRPEGRLIFSKEKLFLYTGGETKLQHNWIGLHIANFDLSLTVEGAQKLGTTAAKNVITLTKEQARKYYRGEDLAGFQGQGPAILKTEDMIIGPGLLQEGKIKNILPESRKSKL